MGYESKLRLVAVASSHAPTGQRTQRAELIRGITTVYSSTVLYGRAGTSLYYGSNSMRTLLACEGARYPQ